MNYIINQLKEIRKGGLEVLLRKVTKVIEYLFVIILFPFILSCLYLVHAIKKWVHIRFGYFVAVRAGHFAADVGIAFSERSLADDKNLDFYFIEKPISNSQWYNMVLRNFYVFPFVKYFYKIDKLIWKDSSHRIEPPMAKYGSRDIFGVLETASSAMQFLQKEDDFCRSWLSKRGWKDSEKFVCLLVRDEAYLQRVYSQSNYLYHNYRNSDIKSYTKTIKELNRLGYWVIRMGKYANQKLEYKNKKFIDYPFVDDQNDLLDIWLMANNYFTITTGTGIDGVSEVYLKPMVYVNYLPLSHMNSWGRAITVPKILKWKKNKRKLTLEEYLDHNYLQAKKYQDAGIIIEDLSSDDILEAVLELESRLSSAGNETQKEKELKKKFWNILKNWNHFSLYHGWLHPDAKVGFGFLRKMGPGFLKTKAK